MIVAMMSAQRLLVNLRQPGSGGNVSALDHGRSQRPSGARRSGRPRSGPSGAYPESSTPVDGSSPVRQHPVDAEGGQR